MYFVQLVYLSPSIKAFILSFIRFSKKNNQCYPYVKSHYITSNQLLIQKNRTQLFKDSLLSLK